ncbi:hypothetical protein [Nitrososphaera viennensis]|uniref:Uncharacterized protein n=2 Tax=Nitrososphaera viennensis TaxID=1034015 RepID=A0A060HFH5_9ARCH|nr:hypothetical protein [Nitrososphaera viennensis]AIC14343.1 hypothetical protein NVIE_001580 [Nitrososphaera viennensis EN76]UVS69335.1 hypothetical protein NWT39_00770 [Nitrososphaera viennensis]
MHKNNVRRRGKLESNLAETVRMASIVQKGVESGRSSYVEMRALARLTGQNVRAKVHKIQASLKKDDNDSGSSLKALLKTLATDMSEGYADVLTPNGIIRDDKLDALLSLDSDIVTCLKIIAAKDSPKEAEDVLKGLVEERKKFVAALRA